VNPAQTIIVVMISILFIIVYFFENAFAKSMPKGLRMFLLQKENPGITGAFRGVTFSGSA
jgi:hypothetical protein